MSEQHIKSRIVHKHDTAENWVKATNFIPKQGELIIYDVDDNHDYERVKIGDGINTVSDLPFTTIDVDYSMLEFDTSLIVSGDPDAAWVGAATINTLKLGKN